MIQYPEQPAPLWTTKYCTFGALEVLLHADTQTQDDLTHSQVFLIIPAFNEAENIPLLLTRLLELHLALPQDPYFKLTVILVDNGSTDDTAPLALNQYKHLRENNASIYDFFIVTEKKRGYGAACLRGIEEASALSQVQAQCCIGFYDADMADDHLLLPSLWERVLNQESDMVIASRVRYAEKGSLSPTQRFGNWLSCSLIRMITGRKYSDLGPMRVISAEALNQLGMQDLTWGWTVEMQFKVARLKLKSSEIDTRYKRRHLGKSKISGSLIGSAKAGYKILFTIARLSLTRIKPHT